MAEASAAPSTRQYLRVAELIVGKGGDGLAIRDLRIAFEVVKTYDETPNRATIKVYNLNDSNQNKVRTEYDDVVLNVGYQGANAIIFRGNIQHVYRYADGTDWIVEIQAGDGDADYHKAIINESLAAGVPDTVLIDKAVGTMPRSTKGPVKGIGPSGTMRGRVVSGPTRDVLRNVARQNNASWSIQDGQVVFVPVDGVLDDEAIVVSAGTGMLGTPEQGDKGITVKSLLNPSYKINGRIKLDNNRIKSKKQKIGETKRSKEEVTKARQDENPVRLDPDGIYKVYKLTHRGDTHGADWYSEMECVGLSDAMPKSDAAAAAPVTAAGGMP